MSRSVAGVCAACASWSVRQTIGVVRWTIRRLVIPFLAAMSDVVLAVFLVVWAPAVLLLAVLLRCFKVANAADVAWASGSAGRALALAWVKLSRPAGALLAPVRMLWNALRRSWAGARGLFTRRAAPAPSGLPRRSFEDAYRIVERLPSGGSTAKVYLVEPKSALQNETRRPEGERTAGRQGARTKTYTENTTSPSDAASRPYRQARSDAGSRCSRPEPGGHSAARSKSGGTQRYVIKHFDMIDGSQVESIVREAGAMRLATQLGLVLDSRMTDTGFYYVMPFHSGRTLTDEVLRIHRGLPELANATDADLKRFLRWLRQLLEVVAAYHEKGVFHKDIKPDNLIVEGDAAHLIDIGLLTPLESMLQLTTHGTEYFRDPEMVKLALRGTPVRDVDCAKFDVYSAGAVLYFMLEGTIPASGSLSRFSRPVPAALQWISSRAMTGFEKRYASARAMLGDVEAVLARAEREPLDAITPSSLPSFEAGPAAAPEPLGPGPLPQASNDTAHAPREAAFRGRRTRRPLAAATFAFLVLAAGGVVFIHLLREARSVREQRLGPVSVEASDRSNAAAWVADRVAEVFWDGSRAAAGAGKLVLTLGAAWSGEARELVRELKLALAMRRVPFEEQGGDPTQLAEASGGAGDLSFDALLESPRRMACFTFRHATGVGMWTVEYP